MFQAWEVKMANMAANSGPNWLPGNSVRKNTTVNDRAENGNGLQRIEQRYQKHLGAAALGRPARVREREYQRRTECCQHPRHGAQRVHRENGRCEGDRRRMFRRECTEHLVSGGPDQHDDQQHQHERRNVRSGGNRRPMQEGAACGEDIWHGCP